jgi:type I restriction enzyme S subunit
MSEYPSDWSRTTFGNVLNQRKESGFTNEDLLAVTSSLGIVKRDTLERRDTSNEDKSKYLLVNEGDIAYNTMRMWQGVSGVSRFRGIVSPAYTICTPTERLDAGFAGYLLKDPEMVSVFRQRSQGLVSDTWNLKYESFAQIPCVIPPLPEQKKIAEILSGIQDVICTKERKRLKLSLLRSSAIAKFTQYGLRKSLLKSSSVGEIPENWRICTLGEVFERYSYGPRFSAEDYSTVGNVRTIRGTDISASDGIRYSQVPLAKLDDRLVSNHALSDGDVVMITTADCGLTSVFREQEQPFICSAYAVRFTPGKAISPDYFALFMQSELALRQVDGFVRKGTVSNLPGSDVMKIKLPLPPVEEQYLIVKIIHSFNSLIKCTDNQIDFYKNIQKSISADLLSGRKRVSI